MNTPFRESLTSYISRLAVAHFVTVGTLINQIIGPRLSLTYLLRSSRYGGSRFYDLGYEINGFGMLSEHISGIISQLCGLPYAADLTLIKWKYLFPNRELLRQHKAWCPKCLTEWKESGQEVFEPLLWSIKLVDSCTKHKVPLECKCPGCKKTIPVLSRKSRNGYCSFCGSWLGSLVDNFKHITESTKSYYFCLSIESLLLRSVDNTPLLFMNSLLDAAGGLCAFCKGLNISKSTASSWKNGKSLPSLYSILSICYAIHINPSEVLRSGIWGNKINLAVPLLKQNTKASIRHIDWIELEEKIREITLDSKIPPPSVREVARSLGCDKRLLYKHFPELCGKVSSRHLIYIEEQKHERISSGEQKLISAIHRLNSSGIQPSRRKIESLLPYNVSLREESYKLIWKNITKL